jgi:hypothetical protein
MKTMSHYIATGIVVAAALASAPAQATTEIGNGTAAVAVIGSPTADLIVSPHTFTFANSLTIQHDGTGAFVPTNLLFGSLNGVVSFSGTVGTTLATSLADFFTFADGKGSSYKFSVDSVRTLSYSVDPGSSSAISLYLLGSTVDAALGLGPTATSLTLSFNSTGSSAFATAATLSVPPAGVPSVPEPATWGMIVVGFGAMGAAMRRRQRTNVTFA